MNKWFFEKFIPSIYSKAGEKKEIWLTARQTNSCLENMNVYIVKDKEGFRHKLADCVWNGRTIRLIYSTKNGCAKLFFGAEALPVFDPSNKKLNTVPNIIRYVFLCKTKKDLIVFTKWADAKVNELTKEGTDIQDLYFYAYKKSVEFQTELFRGLDGTLTKEFLANKFAKLSARSRKNEKLLIYINNRMSR